MEKVGLKHRRKDTKPDNRPLSEYADGEVMAAIQANLTGPSTIASVKKLGELIRERDRRGLPIGWSYRP
jgi:hypothetical protein